MTAPEERTRTLIDTGEFLQRVGSDQRLPEELRLEARRLLRHFPAKADMDLLPLDPLLRGIGLARIPGSD